MSGLALRSKANWGYSKAFLVAREAVLTVDPDRFGMENDEYFVCCDGRTILGFFSLQSRSLTEYEFDALFVGPAHIGTGIGRSLMQHAIATAPRLGARRLNIQSDPDAADLCLAAGAGQTGRREPDSIPGRLLPMFAIAIDKG